MNVVSPIVKLVDQTIKKQIIEQALTSAGLLAIPGIGPFLSFTGGFVFDKILTWLLDETVIGGARIFVLESINWKVSSADDATLKLKDMLENPNKYTDAKQVELEKDFDANAVSLIHIVNARLTS